MKVATNLTDTLFVLFGASGDLAWRLVVPALFDLFLDGHLPSRFQLLAVDLSDKNDAEVAQRFHKGISENSRRGEPAEDTWQAFAVMIRHIKLNVTSNEDFQKLAGMLAETEQQWASQAVRIFYLATPSTPLSLFAPYISINSYFAHAINGLQKHQHLNRRPGPHRRGPVPLSDRAGYKGNGHRPGRPRDPGRPAPGHRRSGGD